MKTNVFKFGGSCFKDKQSFEQSLFIVQEYEKEPLIIVCSALFGITNKLIEFGNSILIQGDIKNAPEVFLNEIKVLHFSFIDYLIPEKVLNDELKKVIEEKLTELTKLKSKIEKEGLNAQNHDYLVSFGERMSAQIYCEYLKSKQLNAQFIPADENFIITDSNFGNSLPKLQISKDNIQKTLEPKLKKGTICIVPGFYGKNKEGLVTTLGRGGSDFTATIIGWALSDTRKISCIFWKDVYGILTANPCHVKKAKLLKEISIKEAKELTFFGTQILHPKCLNTVERGNNIVVEIRNFNDPCSMHFTKITKLSHIPKENIKIVKAITSLEEVAMITVESDAMVDLPGTAAKIFSIIAEYHINIIFITQGSSENNISFGVRAQEGFKVSKLLARNKHFGSHWFNVKVEHEVALLSVIGAGMVHKPGIAGVLFTTLGNAGINIRAISQGSSEMNITMIISRHSLRRAIKVIHNAFIEGNLPTSIAKW